MSEKKRFNKKWLILLATLVLIAIIVVTVVLLLPKNTKEVVKQTQTQTTSMFLTTNDEEIMYASFQEKIRLNAVQYVTEASTVKQLSKDLTKIIKFYNQFLVLAADNGVFQNNYHVIMDGFNNANGYQKEMDAIIKEVYEKVNASSTFTEGAWTSFQSVYVKYVTSYHSAIAGLNRVFQGCLPAGIMSNEFTFQVLNTVDDYLDVIIRNYDSCSAIAAKFSTFVNSYVTNWNATLSQYKFSKVLQEKLKTMSELQTVYGKDVSFKKLIETIDETGINYPSKDTDTNGILVIVKTFLNGGLSA